MSNRNGRFGPYGGQYIPETLMNAVIELERAYNHYKGDPAFNEELTKLFNEYAGKEVRYEIISYNKEVSFDRQYADLLKLLHVEKINIED